MADLLSEVEYGRILGSFTAVSEDFGDTVAPDAIPLSGRVTFVPSTSYISYINSEGETASLYLAPVNAVISQGRIVGKDGKDGVVLLASNSNNVSASVMWTARISLDPINSGDEAPETHSFLIEVRRGEIASLIDVIKENSRVHNIALFHDAIAEAAAKFWERVESGEFRGNQGPPGPPGVGVGVAGPRGLAGKNGADGAPGVGGNMIPDGDLESPGFLSYGDYQESYDAVSGDKSVSLTNATSRKIAVEPEKSYVGSVYVKADYDVTFKVSLRVFGDQGDIDRVIDYSYEIPSGFWKKVTFLLDSEVGDQSVELVVSSDGRVVLVDNFWLSDSSAVRGLQTELVATQERIEAALDKLDMDIDQVDSERVKLTESLNDLSVILEDAEIDLGNVNNQLDDLRDALANAAVGDNYYRDQNLSKPSGFTEDPSVTHSEGGGFGGGGSITVASGETVRGAYDTLTIDSDSRTKVTRGTQYKISARIQPEGDLPEGGGYLALRPITVAGSILPSDRLDPIFIMAPETPGGSWSEISQVVDIPDGTVEVMVGVFLDASYEGSAVFSDIGVRKAIDGTIIAPGAVGSGQISPDSIGTPHLIALAITADKIGANAIVAGKIDALAVNTRELAAEAVSAGKLAADSVIAGKVAADSISAREIIARSITAEKIEADSITANEIKARTITAAEIATGTITAEEIAGRTITAEEIETGTITANELNAENITANSAIIDGLWVNGLNTKTLSTSRLSVEPGNSFPDPFFQDKAKWENSNVQILADGPDPLDSFLRITTTSSQVGSYYGGADSRLVSLTPGTTYHIQLDVRISSGGSSLVAMYLRGRDVNGNIKTISSSFTPTSSNGVWATYSSSITVPATHQYMHTVGLYTRSPYYAGETVDFRNVRLVSKVSSTLIEDGAVTTQAMAANTIDGDRIRAGTLSANKITGGSFEGKTFTGGTFEGGLVVGGVVSTSMYASTTGGVHLSTNYGLRAWNSSGTQTVSIDPKNGDLRMGAGVYLTGSDRNGLVLNPPSKIGTASIYFTRGEGMGASEAAIWRPGYTNQPEHLRIRGANGEGIYVQGGLSEFQYSVNVGADLSVGGVSFLGETYMYGYLRYEGAPSSGVSNANLYMNPTNNIIARMTSSRRYKENIRDWGADPEAVLALRPRTWQAITPMEGDDPEAWFVGFVAEEVHDLGLTELVQYDTEGRPDALHYATFSVAQQAVLIKHEEDIKGLISRIKMLEEKL